MAGCGSYAKIEGFAFLPVTCFTMALTTFVSQNLGAKQYDRAKKGARFGILCSITIAELIGFVIYAAAPTLIAAFNSDPAVVHYGVMQARTIALFYFLLAFSHCIAAVLRGSGNASIPDARHALCLVPVPRQLHYRDGPADPGYPSDFLGLPADLEYQFCHFPVSVFERKMGIRF